MRTCPLVETLQRTFDMTILAHPDTPSHPLENRGLTRHTYIIEVMTVTVFVGNFFTPFRYRFTITIIIIINRRVVFDHLDKAFCILKLDISERQCGQQQGGERERRDKIGTEQTSDGEAGTEGWEESSSTSCVIRRVDFIVSPPDQYPFALVSWTGSKVYTHITSVQSELHSVNLTLLLQQFNRSMRRYSVKECGMSVTAHGIYSMAEVSELVYCLYI